jgi:hypothetical protein
VKDRAVYVYILLGLLAGAVLLPHLLTYQKVPSRDSGVFLYIGEEILKGKIPYRDMWDHKGPAIYYIDAFGLLIGQGSRGGVWFLEFLSLYTAALAGYILMRRTFGSVPAIFSSITWLISLYLLLGGGNYTEEFTLLFQFATLYLFWRSKNSASPTPYMFFVGTASALSFLLRPNNIGLLIAIVILILWSGVFSRDWYNILVQILAMSFGIATIFLIVISYFVWNNSFGDFLDAVFRFNSVYARTTLRGIGDSTFTGLEVLTPSGISIIALAAWIITCLSIRRSTEQHQSQTLLLYLALIGLPIEFFLTGISGRSYPHYYMLWLPIFAILTSFFAFEFLENFSSSQVVFKTQRVSLSLVWLFALLVAMSALPTANIARSLIYLFLVKEPETPQVVEQIQDYTSESDYLLMWGAETRFNFITKTQSPTRFIYQYPLYECGYQTEGMVLEFLGDVSQKKPLIVDTSSSNQRVPPLDDVEREKWSYKNDTCGFLSKMNGVFKFINSNYELVGFIEPNHWSVYRYKGG